MKLQKQLGWYEKDEYPMICKKWDAIRALLRTAPTQEEMLGMLRRIGLSYDVFLKLYGQTKIIDGIHFAKDLKDRYSVLWLAYLYC